ncbi:hypothetical protein JCM5350_007690 [Sporobolomyces pararoseus]
MTTSGPDQSFLEIGRHCSEESCRQLDFLPFKCPTCSLPFCSTHWRPPSGHSCPSYNPSLYDNRVPSCPLCSLPVPPLTANGDPNESMNLHLENDCSVLHPEKKKREKPKNECQVAKCKNKLLVEIKCEKCRGKFCTSHRFEKDHKCDGGEAYRRRLAEEDSQRRKGKPFGGFLNKSSSSSNSSTTTKKATTNVSSGDRLDGMGQAGLAALRRAQQQASTRTANLLNSASTASSSSASKHATITVDDSDSSIEIVSHKPATSSTSTSAQIPSKPSSSSSYSSKQPVPASKPIPTTSSTKPPATKATSKRAKAEQLSARKALETRYEKGLLSEKEKLMYAEMRAEEAKNGAGNKEKDGCRIM